MYVRYDALVTEENSTHFLQSCVRDFTEMWNTSWAQEIPVVLFLNKRDLFEEKLHVLPLNHFFLDFTGNSPLLLLHCLFVYIFYY